MSVFLGKRFNDVVLVKMNWPKCKEVSGETGSLAAGFGHRKELPISHIGNDFGSRDAVGCTSLSAPTLGSGTREDTYS